MMQYKVGDKVVIVKERVRYMCNSGGMDKWLGSAMTIRAKENAPYRDGCYRMEEDRDEGFSSCGGWSWNDTCIDHEATARLHDDNKTFESGGLHGNESIAEHMDECNSKFLAAYLDKHKTTAELCRVYSPEQEVTYTAGDALRLVYPDIAKVGYYYSKKEKRHFIRVKLVNGSVGKAFCHPDDEFNPYVGICLARKRAIESKAKQRGSESVLIEVGVYKEYWEDRMRTLSTIRV
ncbi:MAG: hypothetical protein GY941_22055 [Planctomycetes bacterium]|nr:hypothetical protein [Planctomycetota bacterium]